MRDNFSCPDWLGLGGDVDKDQLRQANQGWLSHLEWVSAAYESLSHSLLDVGSDGPFRSKRLLKLLRRGTMRGIGRHPEV